MRFIRFSIEGSSESGDDSYTRIWVTPGAMLMAIWISRATSSLALPGNRLAGTPLNPSMRIFFNGGAVVPALLAYPVISEV